MGKAVRLDKFLADAELGTRSEVKKLIQKGMIRVEDEICRQPERRVVPGETRIFYREEPVQAAQECLYYLLHKPAGCVSATEDPKEKTVMDFIPSKRRGLFPVGRLDKDTEGLLLITDDGLLAHCLLSPKKHVDKTYYAKTAGIVTEEDMEAMKQGVDIGEERPTLPAVLEILSTDPDTQTSEIRLTIQEGKYHQVKRMMEAVGKKVTYLRRISMGPLTLPPDLLPGHSRPLTEAELSSLKATLMK